MAKAITTEQVKEAIQNVDNPHDLVYELSLDYVETTAGTNGYPKHLKKAIIADSVSELLEIKEALEGAGVEVEPYVLYKKNGWSLWNRKSSIFLKKGYWKDWNTDSPYFDLDTENETQEKILSNMIDFIYGGEEELIDFAKDIFDEEENENIDEVISELKKQAQDKLGYLEGKVRIYYTDNFDFDYEVNDESIRIDYDSQSQLLALQIDGFEEEEE